MPAAEEVPVLPADLGGDGKLGAAAEGHAEANVRGIALLDIDDEIHQSLSASLRRFRGDVREVLQIREVANTPPDARRAEDIADFEGQLARYDVVLRLVVPPNDDVLDVSTAALDDLDLVANDVIVLVSDLVAVYRVEDVAVLVVKVGDRLKVRLELIEVEDLTLLQADLFTKLFVGEDGVPLEADSAEGVLLSLFDKDGEREVDLLLILVSLEIAIHLHHFGIDEPPLAVVTLDSVSVLLEL